MLLFPRRAVLYTALIVAGSFAGAAAQPGNDATATTPFDAPASEQPTDPFAEEATGQADDSPFDEPSEVGEAANPFDVEDQPPATPVAMTPAPVTVAIDSAGVRGLYVRATSEGFQTSGQIEQLASDVRAAGFNRLYVEARIASGTAYESGLEVELPFITPTFTNPLEELAGQLPQDVELIAVVDLLPAFNAALGSRPPEENPVGRRPELRNISLEEDFITPSNQIYYDPGHPETTAQLVSLLEEIESEVRPDGYLFRGVDYPGRDWGYSDGAVNAFRRQVGGYGPPPADNPTWSAWRRSRLTNLLLDLADSLPEDRTIGVLLPTNGQPPIDWAGWLRSSAYADRMQDWIEWGREGVVDEIVLEVHERVSPQGNVLADWTNFLNDNITGAARVVSLRGGLNFTRGFTNQYDVVRSRGVGTLLDHYADPARSRSRGFFASLPNVIFGNAPGRPLPGRPLRGDPEVRLFARMSSPPPAALLAEPTPVLLSNPLGDQPVTFATPTPPPTPTPVPRSVPSREIRTLTLASGQVVTAVVLEYTEETITLRPEEGAPVILSRDTVQFIDPPL